DEDARLHQHKATGTSRDLHFGCTGQGSEKLIESLTAMLPGGFPADVGVALARVGACQRAAGQTIGCNPHRAGLAKGRPVQLADAPRRYPFVALQLWEKLGIGGRLKGLPRQTAGSLMMTVLPTDRGRVDGAGHLCTAQAHALTPPDACMLLS